MRRTTVDSNASSLQKQSSFMKAPQRTATLFVAPSTVPNFQKESPAINVSPNPLQTKATSNQPPDHPTKQLTAKDIFRLRYMRFKSLDMEATLDFYQTLGMNLDFKSDQGVWINPNANLKKGNTTNQTQGKSKKDTEPVRVALPPPSLKKMVVGFSFKAAGSTVSDPNDHIQLIFEKDLAKDEKVCF